MQISQWSWKCPQHQGTHFPCHLGGTLRCRPHRDTVMIYNGHWCGIIFVSWICASKCNRRPCFDVQEQVIMGFIYLDLGEMLKSGNSVTLITCRAHSSNAWNLYMFQVCVCESKMWDLWYSCLEDLVVHKVNCRWKPRRNQNHLHYVLLHIYIGNRLSMATYIVSRSTDGWGTWAAKWHCVIMDTNHAK